MRISDWSSDVCSSDLLAAQRSVREFEGELLPSVELQGSIGYQPERTSSSSEGSTAEVIAVVRGPLYQQGAASSRVREATQVASQRRLQAREAIRDRKSYVLGQGGYNRVDHGGSST